MEIEHQQSGTGGAFVVRDGDDIQAEMTYSKDGDQTVVIDHTTVSDALGGQGVGKQLVNAAVDWARANRIQIVPVCPFARSVLTGDDQYADVLRSGAG